MQLVRPLPILEGDNDDEEGVGVFLPKHMRCPSHTLNLAETTDAGKTLNKYAIYKKCFQRPKRCGINSQRAARGRMS